MRASWVFLSVSSKTKGTEPAQLGTSAQEGTGSAREAEQAGLRLCAEPLSQDLKAENVSEVSRSHTDEGGPRARKSTAFSRGLCTTSVGGGDLTAFYFHSCPLTVVSSHLAGEAAGLGVLREVLPGW